MKQRFKQLAAYTFGKEHLAARTLKTARLSAMFNAITALLKVALGIYSLSLFVCVSGFYNVGIAFAKHQTYKSHNAADQQKRYKRVGLIILASSLIYLVYCTNMAIRGKANITYNLVTALAIATFTFAEIAIAIYGVLRAKSMNNLMLSAAKRINLATALISLVLTQSALLGLENTPDAAVYCGWTGLIFGTVSAIIGLRMALAGGKQKNKKE